jgi:hypothetical protein
MSIKQVSAVTNVINYPGDTLIATATPAAATSVSFSSIPTIYKNLRIRWVNVRMSVDDQWFNVRFNGDTGSNYVWSALGAVGASGTIGTTSGSGTTSFGGAQRQVGVIPSVSTFAISGRNSSGVITIYDYATISDRRQILSHANGDVGGAGVLNMCSGFYNSSSAPITSIEFVRSSTQTITGTFYLYGVS